jgi:hypothetical protein
MTTGELYDLKRNNFKFGTLKHFEFLVQEYHFNYPEHKFSEQSNGAITRDKFEFISPEKTIIVLNAYHPHDYGFEINIMDNRSKKSQMLYYVSKEDQDISQGYLKSSAEFLKSYLKKG